MARLVLIPGAWHFPTHYSSLTAALAREGYIVDSIANKSLESSTVAVEGDAARQRELILALVEAGHDVVVITHSYGGVPGGIAAAGLSKASRSQEGKKGGVIGLLYISSFVLPEKTSLLMASGGQPAPWVEVINDLTIPTNPEHVFYTDCKPEDVEVAVKLIKPQAALFMSTSSDVIPAWKEKAFDGRRAYLLCLNDQAIPASVQRAMAEGWDLKEIDADHSPFLSKTEETTAWIVQKVQQFSQ